MSFISAIAGSKLAIGLITLGTITAGGTAAAAYTGSLPAPLQAGAHALIGAPAPQVTDDPTAERTVAPASTATGEPTDAPAVEPAAIPSPTAVPQGPDATGPAAFGLCSAYAHGGLGAKSVALSNLSKAAGGSAGIDAYCATVTAAKAAEEGPSTAPTSEPDPVKSEAPETDATDAPEPGEDATSAPAEHDAPSVPQHGPSEKRHGRP